MRRSVRSRARVMAVVALVPVVIGLAACGGGGTVEVGPAASAPAVPATEAGPAPASAAPGSSDSSGSPGGGASGQPTPEVGECRGPVDLRIIEAPDDARDTVDCGGGHGTETFWVGEMDAAVDAWPGSDERAAELVGLQVDAECRGRHLDYLGFDPVAATNLPPDRLQVFAYYVPTEADFADGARWFRCDALIEPLTAAERTTIDDTLAGVYASPLPVGYRLCEARLGQTVACDEPHELEYLASVVLDDLTEYPAQRGDVRVVAACRGPLLEALGLTQERADLLFGYVLPTEAAWNAGAMVATCVAGAADGAELDDTLAALGPDADLPLV